MFLACLKLLTLEMGLSGIAKMVTFMFKGGLFFDGSVVMGEEGFRIFSIFGLVV